jgi:hypothetical protein
MREPIRLAVVPDLTELLRDPLGALGIPPADAREMLVRLAPLIRALKLAAAQPEPDTIEKTKVRLVSAEEAAELLGRSRREIYALAHRADWRPFTRRLSRRKLLFEREGVLRWAGSQEATGP